MVARGAETWLSLAWWTRETRNLENWQGAVASGIARVINSKKRPATKQAADAERALEEARKKGFKDSRFQSV